MADLTVNYAGVELKNPLVLASATPGWEGEMLKRAGLAGAGAVIPKTIGPPAKWAAHPMRGRFALVENRRTPKKIGMINLELYTTKTKEEWLYGGDLKIAAEGGAKIIGSIVGQPEPEASGRLAKEVEDTGLVSMVELNLSCPMPNPGTGVGFGLGADPNKVWDQVSATKSYIKIPLAVKLTPNTDDMVPIARAAVKAGADALTITNTVRSFPGVNIETGKPVLPAYGGYSGPAIKPIVQRHVAEVAKAVDVPIAAVGGVRTWEDVAEYIMLGATVVQMCTVIMLHGYESFGKIAQGLKTFMEDKGYRTLEEFRGKALPHIVTLEEYASERERQEEWFKTLDGLFAQSQAG